MLYKADPAKQFEESVSLNPSFPWALTAVIGQMAQSFVIGLPRTARITAHGRTLCKCVWLFFIFFQIFGYCYKYTQRLKTGFVVQGHISRQCQLSFCMATTAWFRRDRVNVLDRLACSPDLTPIENVWPVMKRRIRQRQSQTAEHPKPCFKRDWTKSLLAKL